jgi:predicted O-methyltransferase YrrM
MPNWKHVSTNLKFCLDNINIDNDKTHILEFGTGGGRSILFIKEELDKQEKKFEVFGFDSNIGLPEDWVSDSGEVVAPKERLWISEEIAEACMAAYEKNNITFFEGWFKDTIPMYKKQAKNIALLHIDCDIYSSTMEVLNNLNEFIVPGTIIIFDEWFYNYNKKYHDHEQKAFYEWVENKNREFKFLDIDMTPGFVEQKTIKITK